MFTLVFVLLLILLVFLRLDTVLFLELLEPQWVGHQSLVGSLFLLLDGEQRVFSNFGSGISRSICELRGDKVLV